MDMQRYPNAKYLRQLHAMRRELQEWERAYRAAVDSTTVDHLKGRFAVRADHIKETWEALQAAVDLMYTMPRLS